MVLLSWTVAHTWSYVLGNDIPRCCFKLTCFIYFGQLNVPHQLNNEPCALFIQPYSEGDLTAAVYKMEVSSDSTGMIMISCVIS